MSRSYRKPYACQRGGACKYFKRWANKTVRRSFKFDTGGNQYKRLYCMWDICDYKWYYPEGDKVRRK